MSTRTQYEADLAALKGSLAKMSQLSADAVEDALEALCTADAEEAKGIIKGDTEVNRMERDIEHRCMTLLLRQQPVASDLRFISAAMKVVTDVERIGDHAADIAEIVPHLAGVRKAGDPAVSRSIEMGRKAHKMLQDAMSAFAAEDEAAAKAVIDFTTNTGEKRYALYQGPGKNQTGNFGDVDESNGKVYTRLWELFSGTTRSLEAKKNEWIWFFLQVKTVGYHNDMYPPSSQGQAREVPVQDHIDEYEVIGPDGYGYPIYALKENHKALYNGLISEEDMVKAYDDANPYENRDPRFYRDITYHGAMFKGKWINTATGADAINAANSTTTGYFTHKFFDGYYTKGMSGDWNMDAPLIRLATIYLVYAEAVTRSKGATDEVYNMMNDLRARSFMAPIPPAAKSNKELLLDYILRERRVELYHEKNRFFSTRFYLEPTSTAELAKDAQWNALPGSNDEKAQQYFTKYGAYPKTQHRICGMRPVEDPNGKIKSEAKRS